MKNKLVVTILTIALSAGVGAAGVAVGSHLVTVLPASNVAAAQVTEISVEETNTEDADAEKAAKEAAVKIR